jgi:hypothetical protein
VLALAAAGVLSAGPIAAAQPGRGRPAPAGARPRSNPPPIAPTRGPGGEPVTPANPQAPDTSIPGLEDADFRIGLSPLRAEGTFLVEQRGSMLKLPTGERIFVFFKDTDGKRERPMVLVPCRELQQMEQMALERPAGAVFVVTGEVLAYAGVNYLLPTVARVIDAPAAPDVPEKQPTEASTPPAEGHEGEAPGAKPAEPGADADVQELIKSLEAQRERPRESRHETGAAPEAAPRGEGAAGATGDAALGVLPEGSAVLRRRGRLVRTSAGQWAFRFDSAPGGDARLDRPLLLVPCMALQRMEAWAAMRGDAASYELSGRLLTYQGRNYLLPTMFQVYPTNDLEARQGP